MVRLSHSKNELDTLDFHNHQMKACLLTFPGVWPTRCMPLPIFMCRYVGGFFGAPTFFFFCMLLLLLYASSPCTTTNICLLSLCPCIPTLFFNIINKGELEQDSTGVFNLARPDLAPVQNGHLHRKVEIVTKRGFIYACTQPSKTL